MHGRVSFCRSLSKNRGREYVDRKTIRSKKKKCTKMQKV